MLRVENGKWKELSYLIFSEGEGAVLIDPGEDCVELIEIIESKNIRLDAILCTHGHYDHIASVAIFQKRFGCSVYLHKNDFDLLRQANFYRVLFSGNKTIQIPNIDLDLSGFKCLHFGDLIFQVLQTPGHTKGGVSFLVDRMLFCGDNIINSKIGRSDLPGGSKVDLIKSVNRLLDLDDEITIFPGHGDPMKLAVARPAIKSSIL